MTESIIKDVMEDVLQELKEANRSLSGLRSAVDGLGATVTGFEQQLKDLKVVVQPPDLDAAFGEIRQLTTETAVTASETIASMQNEAKEMLDLVMVTVAQKLSAIQAVIDGRLAEQPKPIMRQWRVSVFPESDRAGSYKYFIRWLFGGTVLVLLVGALFSLGRQYLDKWHPSPDKPRQSMSMPEEKSEGNGNRVGPSVMRYEEWMATERALIKKKVKLIDSCEKYLIRQLEDSVRRNGGKLPEKTGSGAIKADSFINIQK
jgi:hypothetical protein